MLDPRIHIALNNEAIRQENTIELIASENYTSDAVMELCGSILTNKYAEGLPGKPSAYLLVKMLPHNSMTASLV